MRDRRTTQTLLSCRRGVAAMEFAITLPFLMLLFFGGVELARFTSLQQKLQQTVSTMADLATQGSNTSTATLSQIGSSASILMQPYSFSGSVIFTSAVNLTTAATPCPANRPCISWQHRVSGSDPSLIGTPGGTPTLPNNYTVASSQTLIAAEVYYDYQPMAAISGMLVPALAPRKLYYVAVYKPRQIGLTALGSGPTTPNIARPLPPPPTPPPIPSPPLGRRR